MLGKEKCRMLKEIRQRIADENDIPYVTRDCGFQGECRGTCPKCESELRYLEKQLALRQSLGKRVAVTALCATMALGAAGCGPTKDEDEPMVLDGEIAPYETEQPDEPLAGEPVPEDLELMGDVAWVPEETEPVGNVDHG